MLLTQRIIKYGVPGTTMLRRLVGCCGETIQDWIQKVWRRGSAGRVGTAHRSYCKGPTRVSAPLLCAARDDRAYEKQIPRRSLTPAWFTPGLGMTDKPGFPLSRE
jgi:hypothetical protein